MHLLFILSFFFFTYPSPTEIYTLSLHDALPILESKGFSVAVFNRTTEVTERFAAGRAKKKNIQPTRTIAEFVGALVRPRKAMIMVKAGAPVDAVIQQLAPLLEKGDVIIDGGNSLFTDTQHREKELKDRRIH